MDDPYDIVMGELKAFLEMNEYEVKLCQRSEEPDLLLQKGDEFIAVEIKVGNPNDPVPSGTGLQIDNQIRHLRGEGVNVHHGVLVTNHQLPGIISKELQARGINVCQSGRGPDVLQSFPDNIQRSL